MSRREGRFLVATGRHSDADGTTRTFIMGAGDNDGTYQTTLSVEQLPPHRHGVDRQGPTRGIEGLPPIGSDGAVLSAIEREQTLAVPEKASRTTTCRPISRCIFARKPDAGRKTTISAPMP